ncbi:AcrR family transcriptional regulator [Rhizobium aethiopicum]|uniref:hypothetical protein n=1 Tax=Rhizobium aethiopicum TaxID=1138170 RepID=UPI0016193F5B|nr:hypothetical protein [Rhizobium aethiopicum]MBB4581575.1 AcrR family transcriptional regulator [Rhizobium aethiopicum]
MTNETGNGDGDRRVNQAEQSAQTSELDWLNDNMVQRYTSALERLEQIYADRPQLRAERLQALWDRLEAFRAGFQRSLPRGEGKDAGNAPESSRAARQRLQPATHQQLPLSEDTGRNVITDLDEMLAEQFPEAYDPARARQPRAAEIPGAEAGLTDIEFDDGSRQGTPVTAASSREEIEQFAQARDDFARISSDFMLSPTPPPGLAPPDEPSRRSPSEGLPRSGGGLGSPSPALDLGFSQGPGPAESRPASRSPFAERFSPEPATLTAAQDTFLANWPHDRQPTFEVMNKAMHDAGNALRGDASSDVDFSNQRESSPVRARKRTRVDLSHEGSSGRESDEEGSSDRPPARRRRLMPHGQGEPSLPQGPDIREDGPSGDRVAREPNRRVRESSGTEPAIDVSGDSGNRETGLDRRSRNPQEPRRTFDDDARAQARRNRSR